MLKTHAYLGYPEVGSIKVGQNINSFCVFNEKLGRDEPGKKLLTYMYTRRKKK